MSDFRSILHHPAMAKSDGHCDMSTHSIRLEPVFVFIVALSMASLAMLLPALAQSDNPAWLDQVQEQLATEKGCKTGFFVSMNEQVIGNRTTYEATVQCEDGRRFDVSRIGPVGPFKVSLCEVQTC